MSVLDDIVALVHVIRRLLGTEPVPPPGKVKLEISVVVLEPTQFIPKGETRMQMTDIQHAVANIQAETSEGNPAQLEGIPTWESDDPSVVIVEPSPDGMTCVIKSPSPGPLGSAVVTVTARLAGETITATEAVDIVASDAAKLSIHIEPPTI